MARARRGTGTVEIIHSSFIDLLFGAFGAFVFLMIAYVIYTMQLTPEHLREAINKTAEENQELKTKLKDYENLEESYLKIKEEAVDLRRENQEFKRNYNELQKELQNMEDQIAALSDENIGLKTKLNELKEASRNLDKIVKENGKLQNELDNAKKELGTLKERLAEVQEELLECQEDCGGNPPTLLDWFKYLFFAVLFIIGSELSAVLSKIQNEKEKQILAEGGAKVVFNPENNKYYIEGGGVETIEKIQQNQKIFAAWRTILWVGIFIVSFIFAFKVLHISKHVLIWMAVSSIALYLFYLKGRFNLLP